MKTIDSFIIPLYDFILVFILDLKKIAVISFALAFADNILLTLISIFLQAIGEPGSTGILKQSFGIITYILGFWGVVAFCVFFLSAIGFALQKLPGRDDVPAPPVLHPRWQGPVRFSWHDPGTRRASRGSRGTPESSISR
jgi:hypothetical protein